MHNHNDNHKGMMWMMVVFCLLPILSILFIGKLNFNRNFRWLIIGGIAVLIISHFWSMTKRKTNIQNYGNQKDIKDRGESCH